MEQRRFRISYGGLCIDFLAPFPMAVPDDLIAFCTEDGEPTDRYRLHILTEPLQPKGELLCARQDLSAYREDTGSLLIFHCYGQIGCLIRPNGEHSLYIPREAVDVLQTGCRIGGFINGEEVLLRHRGILLHSSVVSHGGQAVLFSGPCGIGKSTQADLWHRTFGDRIINGDRGLIRHMGEEFYVGGSPWCGSSEIRRKDFIPIRAIVLLRQGTENVMTPADPRVAFREIYSQCLVHSWDRAFVDGVCELIGELITRISVYTLSCLPEASAAELAKTVIFPNE